MSGTFVGVRARTYPRPAPIGWKVVRCDDCGESTIVEVACDPDVDAVLCGPCLIALVSFLMGAVRRFAAHPPPGSEEMARTIRAILDGGDGGRTH